MNNTTISFTNSFTNQFGHQAFFDTVEAFREKARKNGLSASEHILYNKLRDLPLNRGFTPVSRPTKLSNGHDPMAGYNNAIYTAKRLLMRENSKVEGGNYLESTFKLSPEMQKMFDLN